MRWFFFFCIVLLQGGAVWSSAGGGAGRAGTLTEAMAGLTAFRSTASGQLLDLPLGSGLPSRFFVRASERSSSPAWRQLEGEAVDDPSARLRLVIGESVVFGQLISPASTIYIDPPQDGSSSYHVYSASEQPSRPHQCLSVGEPASFPSGRLSSQSVGHVIRTFRLATAATGEFTEYHGGSEQATLAVAAIMSRVSAIFERDVGVRLQLVPGFEDLVFPDPEEDPYSTNEPSIELLREAQAAFDAQVGSENYDLGIVLTRGTYGLNHLASVCNPQLKGASCLGLPEPNGDAFHVNLVVHELAHQFGAAHTFNSAEELCAGRRREWSAFEPGTGSTLMGYAGLPCGADGFQSGNDDYFHSESLKQIRDFLNSPAAACAEVLPSENQPPSIHAGPEYTIPSQTPFALTATGTDPDGHQIWYCWEQRDRGPARPLDAPDDGLGPLFRSYPPSTNATRSFPALPSLLANEPAPGEQLPSTERVLRFRVTARDAGNDGAVAWADTQVFVTAEAGPFQVLSHATAESLQGSTEVRWDVAGTDLPPVRAEQVQISLSIDGGQSFPFILAQSTANDGLETVALPEVATQRARLKVAPIGNIFFAINTADFAIGSPNEIRISAVERQGQDLVITWSSAPGADYKVQAVRDLTADEWETVHQLRAEGEISTSRVQIRPGSGFLRVLQE